jgi:hypothetical protein
LIEKKIEFVNDADASKKLEASLYLYIDTDNNCLIKLHKDGDAEIIFSANDFFDSLVKLRNWIYEKEQLLPMCKGALINVYPSRMSRQMSNGMKAYYLTKQKQAHTSDIVDIFDLVKVGEEDKLSTPKQQLEYFKKWIKSL